MGFWLQVPCIAEPQRLIFRGEDRLHTFQVVIDSQLEDIVTSAGLAIWG